MMDIDKFPRIKEDFLKSAIESSDSTDIWW